MKKVVLFPILLIFLFSCKKQEESCQIKGYTQINLTENIGQIASNPYLAAYPESWWNYSDGYERTCIEVEYVLLDRKRDENKCTITQTSSTALLPQIQLISVVSANRIYKDSWVSSNDTITVYHKLVDTLVGNSWLEYEASTAIKPRYSRRVEAFYDTFELPNGDVYSNVVKLIKTKSFYTGTNYLTYEDQYYFAKDIGIIWEIIPECPFNGINTDLDRYLVEYYIAPH